VPHHDEILRGFFVRYGEALAAGDLRAIAKCYALPALVLSDAGSIPVAAGEEIEAAFRSAVEAYRDQGLVAARPTIIGSEAITGRLVSADVRWDYLDEQGRLPLLPTARRGRAPHPGRHSHPGSIQLTQGDRSVLRYRGARHV
jgi:hypothetical protein